MANELDNITDNINDFGSEYDSIISVNNIPSRDLEAINNSPVFSIKRSILNYPAQDYFTFISKGYRFIQGIMRYGFFSEYKSTRIYSLNAKVCVSSSYYRSLIDNNLGADLSASNYNSATTYALNANAKDSSTGDIYKSLIANNLNNALTDNTKWQLIWKRLSPVIESNSYNDLFDKPTNLSQFIDDTGSLKSISTYSVISAKTDASGYASFVNKVSNTEISFDVSAPIVLCYADGFIESNSTLSNITGISTDGTYFIVKEKGNNPYTTTLQPVESQVAPSTPATNQLWLDISVMPYVPKKWNGSQWVATQFVKLGEFVRASGILGSPVSYALNRRYKSDEFTVVFNTTYTRQDNLGTLDANVELYARCISAEHGYAINSIVKPIPFIQSIANRAIPSAKYDRNSSSFCSYNFGDSGMIIPSLTAKSDAGMTSSRWKFFFVVQVNF